MRPPPGSEACAWRPVRRRTHRRIRRSGPLGGTERRSATGWSRTRFRLPARRWGCPPPPPPARSSRCAVGDLRQVGEHTAPESPGEAEVQREVERRAPAGEVLLDLAATPSSLPARCRTRGLTLREPASAAPGRGPRGRMQPGPDPVGRSEQQRADRGVDRAVGDIEDAARPRGRHESVVEPLLRLLVDGSAVWRTGRRPSARTLRSSALS